MTQARLNDDARLSRTVVETVVDGEKRLYDTLTRRSLPLDANEAALTEALFLAGQEEEALVARLFEPRRTLVLTVIVTWECNLRCNHCTVLGRLEDRRSARLDVAAFEDFVRRFREQAPEIERLKLSFLGGEPLLDPELCLDLIDSARKLTPEAAFDTTTNLAVPLEEAELALLGQLDDIVVSLDGLEAAHNKQRRPYKASFNPFERTIANLERLVAEGLAERILVQGAIRDEFASLPAFQDFQRTLMKIGVRYDRIVFDTIHPTAHRPNPQQSFLDALAQPTLRVEPCCKYRGARKLVLDQDGTLYSDYYDWRRLGTLDTEIPELLARHRALVFEEMPALHDETCRRCPALGLCWGGCTNVHGLTEGKPSRFCGQDRLIARIRELASKNELVGITGGGCEPGPTL